MRWLTRFLLQCVLVSAFAYVLATGLALAFPTPPRETFKEKTTAKEKSAVPDLRMQSNWGQVHQDGQEIAITGNTEWFAFGKIRKDGKIELIWTEAQTQRPAPALYEWDGKQLTGQWGFEAYVENGELKSFHSGDTIYPAKQADPIVSDVPDL